MDEVRKRSRTNVSCAARANPSHPRASLCNISLDDGRPNLLFACNALERVKEARRILRSKELLGVRHSAGTGQGGRIGELQIEDSVVGTYPPSRPPVAVARETDEFAYRRRS